MLDDDAIVITDSGTITAWTARHVDMRGSMQFSCSGTLASMACGLPYAIGASIAFPTGRSSRSSATAAAAMLMGDFVTLRKYNLNAKIIVIKNNALGQIKWEQMVFLGNPEYGCELEPIDFAEVARAAGSTPSHRRSGALRRAATGGAGDAGTVPDRGGGRPLRAAVPPKIEAEAGAEHGARRSPRARRTR